MQVLVDDRMSEQLNDGRLEVKREREEEDGSGEHPNMVDVVCNRLENATQREQQGCHNVTCHKRVSTLLLHNTHSLSNSPCILSPVLQSRKEF